MKRYALHELATRGGNTYAALYKHFEGKYCTYEEAAAIIAERDREIEFSNAAFVAASRAHLEAQEQLRASNEALVDLDKAWRYQLANKHEALVAAQAARVRDRSLVTNITEMQIHYLDSDLTALESDRKEVAKKASIKTLKDAADSNEFDSDTNYKLRRMAAELRAEG